MSVEAVTVQFAPGEQPDAKELLRVFPTGVRVYVEELTGDGWRPVFAGDADEAVRAIAQLDPAMPFRISRRVLLP